MVGEGGGLKEGHRGQTNTERGWTERWDRKKVQRGRGGVKDKHSEQTRLQQHRDTVRVEENRDWGDWGRESA